MSIIINGTQLSKGKKQYFNGVQLTKIYYQDNTHGWTLVWEYDVSPHTPGLSSTYCIPTYQYGEGWQTGIPSSTNEGVEYSYNKTYAWSWAWAGHGGGVGCGATAIYEGYIYLPLLPDWQEIARVVIDRYNWGAETHYISPGQTTVWFRDEERGSWDNAYFPTSDKSWSYSATAGLRSFTYYYA